MKYLTIIFILISSAAIADENYGKVCFGRNLAKPANEHLKSLYLTIGNSGKLFFNNKYDQPILDKLDLTKEHNVKVFLEGKVVASWVLNYSDLKSNTALIWRSPGAWRMEKAPNNLCN